MNKSRFVICANKEVCVRFAPSSGFRSIHKNGKRYYYNKTYKDFVIKKSFKTLTDALCYKYIVNLKIRSKTI